MGHVIPLHVGKLTYLLWSFPFLAVCSFCRVPSFLPPWMRHCPCATPPPPPHTHTHNLTHGVLDCLLYCAFSNESPCGVLLFLLKSLVGYHCSIVASTPHSMACTRTHVNPSISDLSLFSHCLDSFFSNVLIGFVHKLKPLTPPQPGTVVPLLLKSPVWIRIQTHPHMAIVGYLTVRSVPFLNNSLARVLVWVCTGIECGVLATIEQWYPTRKFNGTMVPLKGNSIVWPHLVTKEKTIKYPTSAMCVSVCGVGGGGGGGELYLLKFPCGVHCSIVARTTQPLS